MTALLVKVQQTTTMYWDKGTSVASEGSLLPPAPTCPPLLASSAVLDLRVEGVVRLTVARLSINFSVTGLHFTK